MRWNGFMQILILGSSAEMARTSRCWVLAGLIALGGLAGKPDAALAEDSIGSGSGDLFHSKGWITPEIYRKAVKSNDKKAQATPKSTAASRANNKTKTVRKKRTRPRRTHQVTRKSSSKLRVAARSPVRTRKRSAKIRRVPPGLARRLDRTGKSSVNLQKYAVKVASLGIDFLTVPKGRFGSKTPKKITGGETRIKWVASRSCLTKRLHAAIRHVALNYGRVRVNSTCRSRRHNRRVGGARRSWHLKGRAADIRVFGNIRKAARYLRRVVGGYKHYGGGLFHIDTGPRRRW